ncbi:hypothetical protein ERJ75_000756700 [Trypanosoma vivax]|nr:hypothetical protein ERJ75_000756700 [Trypanosoma vivax]
MGHSAKITRGGDKSRTNQGRREAKMRAQGAKQHIVSAKETEDAKRVQRKKSQSIATELRAKSMTQAKAGPIVNMVPKISKPEV